MGTYYSAEQIRQSGQGRWRNILLTLGVSHSSLSGKHAACPSPSCGAVGKNRDRFRFDDQGGRGTFLCSQGGRGILSGDGLACVMHAMDWDFRTACQRLGEMLLCSSHLPVRSALRRRQPSREMEQKPVFDMRLLEDAYHREYAEPDYLYDRSPVDPASVTPTGFLDAIGQTGERY